MRRTNTYHFIQTSIKTLINSSSSSSSGKYLQLEELTAGTTRRRWIGQYRPNPDETRLEDDDTSEEGGGEDARMINDPSLSILLKLEATKTPVYYTTHGRVIPDLEDIVNKLICNDASLPPTKQEKNKDEVRAKPESVDII